jgi:bile acid:Na+ symporter, BASS family
MDALPQHIQRLTVLAFLASSMSAVGLTLTPAALVAPLRDVPLVTRAPALNFVIAPAFAWLLTCSIPLERGYAIGLLLLGGAAGAAFLPKLVETAKDDLALAAALMGLLTAGTIVFLPFAVPLIIPGLQADPWGVARPLLLLVVLPPAVGMLIRNRAATLAAHLAPMLAKIGNVSLLLLLALLVAFNSRALLGILGSGAILAALLYFSGLFIVGGPLGGAKPETRRVLALATAARNFGAALRSRSGQLHRSQCHHDDHCRCHLVPLCLLWRSRMVETPFSILPRRRARF